MDNRQRTTFGPLELHKQLNILFESLGNFVMGQNSSAKWLGSLGWKMKDIPQKIHFYEIHFLGTYKIQNGNLREPLENLVPGLSKIAIKLYLSFKNHQDIDVWSQM